MKTKASGAPEGFAPPPQHNLRVATQRAVEALRRQTDEQLVWLGAKAGGVAWRLPVLNDVFEVDVSAGRVSTPDGREVGPPWRILALHYLAVTGRPEPRPPELTFADLPAARAYAAVYQRRVIARLCATAGRDEDALRAASAALGAREADGGDLAFDLDVFPRLTVRWVWYAADEEFPPSATLLLPGNIESFFRAEDMVVLSERLVSRLSGRPF